MREADGQQRRSMVTDVRPFLVCGMGSTLPGDCKGSAQVRGSHPFGAPPRSPGASLWMSSHFSEGLAIAFLTCA